jgi:glyoxylase-like metal-dependent hydrolase (beta-lactamase superfamily II)
VVDVRRIEMGYNNVYLLESGDAPLQIDTGPDYRGARESLGAESGSRPSLVVATHAHQDHAGLGGWWQSSGVPVAIGERDVHSARAGGQRFGGQHEWEGFLDILRASGAPADIQVEMRAALGRSRSRGDNPLPPNEYAPPTDGHWPTALRYDGFEPARLLADGDALDDHARVLLCPGHTPGNLVVVVESEGWLFSGDQLLPDITPTPAIQWEYGNSQRFKSLLEFRASMERLARLQFTRCFPGHGQPFDNAAETIAVNLAQIEQRNEKVLAAVRERPSTLYGLCEALYPRVLKRRFWQIVATVLGHLDILEVQGAVRRNGEAYECAR